MCKLYIFRLIVYFDCYSIKKLITIISYFNDKKDILKKLGIEKKSCNGFKTWTRAISTRYKQNYILHL